MASAQSKLLQTKSTQILNQHNIYRPLAIAIALAVSSASHAATFTVTNINDAGAGSLRQAVIDANGAAGADDIVFSPVLTGQTITLTTGEIEITDSLTIAGSVAGDAKSITIDGNENSRIIHGLSGSPITLKNLTLTKGKVIGTFDDYFQGVSSQGGAIKNKGSLVINNSFINNNIARSDFNFTEAVYSESNITLSNSIVSNNQSGGVRGDTVTVIQSRISNNRRVGVSGKTITLNQSTVSNNSGGVRGNNITLNQSSVIANGGTGVSSPRHGNITLNNSTIANNTGGGVLCDAQSIVTINQSTISNNQGFGLSGVDSQFIVNQSTITENVKGGVYLSTYYYQTSIGVLTLNNTILSGNSSNNLETRQYYSNDDNITINVQNSLIGDNASVINGTNTNNIFSNTPKLKPLFNNGGETANRLPEADSPALNKGNNTLFSGNIDQRGKPRVYSSIIDIGSVERQASEPAVAKLSLVKSLSNLHGGTAIIDDFVLTASGATIFSGISGSTEVTQVEITPGVYNLSETSIEGYQQVALGCAGSEDNDPSDGVTIKDSENVICTFFNVDQPATLTLTNIITNNNGGSATLNNFTLYAGNFLGVSGSDAVTNASIDAGLYFISESIQPNYTLTSIQCTDRPDELLYGEGRNITLKNGENVSCTFTNDYRPAKLTLANIVINDDEGNAIKTDWTLQATSSMTVSGIVGSDEVASIGVRTGLYTLSAINGPDGYKITGWQCDAGQLNGNLLTLNAGDNATCTATINDNSPQAIPTLSLAGLLSLIASFVALFGLRRRVLTVDS